MPDAAHQRILRGAAATLIGTHSDADGEPAAPTGTVTVHVQTADGTDVLPAGTATAAGSGTGESTVDLSAANTAALGLLTATWTDDGDDSTWETLHEIVGGFFFTVAQARQADDDLADTSRYPAAEILRVRTEVERECEWICDQAFVPRYRRVAVDGRDDRQLVVPDNTIRSVVSVRVYSDPTTYEALTPGELAELTVGDRVIERAAADIWPVGRGNVVVEYAHGWDRPPEDLARAAIQRLRHRLNADTSGIPDRAASFAIADGGVFNLSMPDRYRTGIPDIDAIYARYSKRTTGGDDTGGGGGPAPAGRGYDFDPSHDSVFHGGRR